MKKILSVIGGFFVSIWRWIKETAWVQPLLIVGIIFGVIFAIPSIVSGINAINERNNSAEAYYRRFQVSLAGAENSSADKLLEEIKSNSEGTSTSLAGQKFFIVFVQSDNKCAACTAARDGFEYLEGDGKTLLKEGNFGLKTIFVDEELTKKNTDDWKKDGTVTEDNEAKTAFEAFLTRNYSKFEDFAGAAQETHFYNNRGITEAQISDIESASVDKFQTPTIIQVDFTASNSGVSNVFIGVNAVTDTKLSKAQYLADAWNYEGIFGPNYVA
ncbi:MAG: hypothetical protein RBS24_05325 [Bacilli bacterium]|nr:hypothetical protein [Bacilli bacterium]